MKENTRKFAFLSGIALMAVTIAALGVSSASKSTKADTNYTITLNNENSPIGASQACPSSYDIETEMGNDITFIYSNCVGDTSNHAQISEGGLIKNADPIHGIQTIAVIGDGAIQYRSSSDGSNWSTYIALTSGISTSVADGSNYVEFSTATGTSTFNVTITYDCQEGSGAPKYNPANYYDGYYEDIVSWTDGEDLEAQLHARIRNGYTAIKYDDPNWDSNKDADHSLNSYLTLDTVYSATDTQTSLTQKAWQREHAFCASLMTGSLTSDAVKHLGRATDFHNLFAGDQQGNGSRGNKNFGTADKTSVSYQNRTVADGYDGYSFDNKNFEPGDKDKGRVARALFYMCTMYNEVEHDEKNNVDMQPLTIVEEYVDYDKNTTSGSNCHFAHGNLSTMLDWALNYDVDTLEMQHNTSVQTYKYKGTAQGNRNPYVDYPELIDYVYGSKKNQAGRLEDIKPAAVDLNYSNENKSEHRAYAIKTAEEKCAVGKTFSHSDVTLCEIKKDFTVAEYTGSWTSSLDGHTFASEDGSSITNTITVGDESISYNITIESMTGCSFYHVLSTTNMVKTKNSAGTDQSITWSTDNSSGLGSVAWTYNLNVTVPSDKTSFTLNNKSGGGITIGSASTYPVTSVTFETQNAYTVDAAYINAFTNSKGNTYQLTMYVGSTLVYSDTLLYNSGQFKIYGESFEPVTGKVKFVISNGSANTSVTIHSLAFNVVD